MIDIIVITYNAKDKLKQCLGSIEKYTKGVKYLLTVVDNCSTDETCRFLKRYRQGKKICIINNKKNLGFSGGANIALKNTFNKFIAFLDDDAEVSKGWLEELYEQIKKNPKIGLVGCKIVLPNNRIFAADYWAKPLYIAGVGELDKGQRDYIKECDILIGTCWLMRRAVIEKIGYFDETFFPSQHEDADYCLRARIAGYKLIYDGRVKIIHHNLFRDGKRFEITRHRFMEKWQTFLEEKFPLSDCHPVNKHMACGYDYFKKKEYKKAIAEFEKVESFDKRFKAPVFFYKGLALKALGKHGEVASELNRAIDMLTNVRFGHSACITAAALPLSLLYTTLPSGYPAFAISSSGRPVSRRASSISRGQRFGLAHL